MGLPKIIQFSGRPSQKMGGKRLLFSSFLPNIFPLLWWFFKSGKCTIKVLWDIEKSSNNGKNWRKALFFFLSTHFYNGYLHPPLKNTSVHTNKHILYISFVLFVVMIPTIELKLNRNWLGFDSSQVFLTDYILAWFEFILTKIIRSIFSIFLAAALLWRIIQATPNWGFIYIYSKTVVHTAQIVLLIFFNQTLRT